MTYRAAVIGCGLVGTRFADDPLAEGVSSHAGAYDACLATELVAVCDVDPAALDACGDRWGVAARYRDAAALLAEQRPEIVSICTPDQTHVDLTRLVLETPGVLAVLAEKPLATALDEAQELVDLASARGAVLAVNHSRRYASTHQHICDSIRAGSIGTIQNVAGFYTAGTLHNGTHWFDLARLLAGEITDVWGFDARREGGCDPTLDAVLTFESGATGHLLACDAAAFSVFEMDLMGTCGRVRIVESGHSVETYRVADSPYYTGYRGLALESRVTAGFKDVLLHAVEDLVYAVRNKRAPRCSGDDAVAAIRVAAAVMESARTHQSVRLNPPRVV